MSDHQHDLRADQSKALWVSLLANGAFLGVELVAGLMLGSLALLADAAHMLSDVVALAIALFAHRLLTRPPSDRHTYGLQRAEVVGAQTNAVVLIALAVWLSIEAIGRLQRDAPQIEGGGLIVVAGLGLAINIGSAVLLRRSQRGSLNMRAAFLHMALDAVGSAAVLVAGVGIVVTGAEWLDPVASLAIAVLIVWSAARILIDATHVLLEGTPKGLDLGSVDAALTEDAAVESIHHLHVWNLASDVPALSAHVVVGNEQTLHDAQLHADRLKAMLADRFGINHATLELECHDCNLERDPPRGKEQGVAGTNRGPT